MKKPNFHPSSRLSLRLRRCARQKGLRDKFAWNIITDFVNKDWGNKDRWFVYVLLEDETEGNCSNSCVKNKSRTLNQQRTDECSLLGKTNRAGVTAEAIGGCRR